MTNNKTLQLCLMMDCTASMQPWIDEAKNKLIKCINDIKRDFKHYHIEISFVGYRDLTDNEQFVIQNFTTNYDLITNVIKNTLAYGGGDPAEDVTGAYCKVCSFKWNADVRLIFHVCDAPNHGWEYHDEFFEDDYPEGTGSPTLKDCVYYLADRDVDINFMRLNDTTDSMVEVMRREYNRVKSDGFYITDVINRSPEVFERTFVHAMTNSIMTKDPEPL